MSTTDQYRRAVVTVRPQTTTAQRTENRGFLVLAATYITLLAGDFGLMGFQLRFLGLPSLILATSAWIQIESPRVRPIRIGTPVVLLSLYALWIMASGEWASPSTSVAPARYDILSLALAIGITATLCRRLSSETISRLWNWIFATAFIYFALGAVSPNSAQGRWQAPGGGPNVFVRAMALGILASVFLTIARRTSFWLLGLPLFTAGALFSGSRGGVASLGLVVLLSLVPLSRKIGLRRIGSIVLRSVVAVAVLIVVVPGDSMTRLSRRFIDSVFVERYTSGRDNIAERALEIAADNLWIGGGLNEVAGRIGTHGHNLFITAISEAGIVGLILLSAAIVSFGHRARSVRPLTLAGFYFAVGGGLILSMSMFSGYYYDTRFVWFFFLLAFFSGQVDLDDRDVLTTEAAGILAESPAPRNVNPTAGH